MRALCVFVWPVDFWVFRAHLIPGRAATGWLYRILFRRCCCSRNASRWIIFRGTVSRTFGQKGEGRAADDSPGSSPPTHGPHFRGFSGCSENGQGNCLCYSQLQKLIWKVSSVIASIRNLVHGKWACAVLVHIVYRNRVHVLWIITCVL